MSGLAVKEQDIRLVWTCGDAVEQISSLNEDWSADVKLTPLALAIERNDFEAVRVCPFYNSYLLLLLLLALTTPATTTTDVVVVVVFRMFLLPLYCYYDS
jgi:hypothetical protein